MTFEPTMTMAGVSARSGSAPIDRAYAVDPAAVETSTPSATSFGSRTWPSIFTSIQALGLKLESRKAPFDTMIVDKLEKRPTEN